MYGNKMTHAHRLVTQKTNNTDSEHEFGDFQVKWQLIVHVKWGYIWLKILLY